jgi:sugar-specific transcriptional regulator TrmB
MVAIYKCLVQYGHGTIKEIQENLHSTFNLSYMQTYNSLEKLVQKKIIEVEKGIDLQFVPINPSTLFEDIHEQFIEEINQLNKQLSDQYQRSMHEFGVCTRQSNYFHFSSIDLGFKMLIDYFIKEAETEIIITAGIPLLLKRLQWALVNAYERGVQIEIHYSSRDFEENPDYINLIRPYIKNYRVKVFNRKYRTYDALSINDEYTRQGNIMIDGMRLIHFPYYKSAIYEDRVEYGIDYFAGFYNAASIIRNIILNSHENPIEEMVEYTPSRESMLLECLKSCSPISKNELSLKANIGGTELKTLLKRLQSQNKIKINKKNNKIGRPAEFVELSN